MIRGGLFITLFVCVACGGSPAPEADLSGHGSTPVTTDDPIPPGTGPVNTSGGNTTQQPNTVAGITAQKGFTMTSAVNASLCLDIAGTAIDGARLILAPCNGAASQRFIMEDWSLKTIGGKCVGTADETQTNYGESMVIRGCDNSVGQHLAMYQGLVYATPSTGWIALGVQGNNAVANANVILAKWDNTVLTQHWAFNVTVPTATGMSHTGFPIASESVGSACLTASGGIVGTTACKASATQMWSFDYMGQLHWASNVNDCLDVNVANDTNVVVGTRPAIQACDGSDTQAWLLSNGYFVQQNLAMEPSTLTPSTTGFTPGVLDANGYLWSVGRGFATP